MVSLLFAVAAMTADLLVNPRFEEGLHGWKTAGEVQVVAENPLEGKSSLKLGPANGSVEQRYDVPGLRILTVGATIRNEPKEAGGLLKVTCLDRSGHRLMELTAHPDDKGSASVYFKTHASTRRVVVAIEKKGAGIAIADNLSLVDEARGVKIHPPQVDLAQAMIPFWLGGVVHDESTLLLSEKGGVATGRLLYAPTRVLSVRDSTLGKTFREGTDYTIEGRTIAAAMGSAIPTMADTDFPKEAEFAWPNFVGRHVFVTYEHRGTWNGPTPTSQLDRLPETAKRLKAKLPLRFVAFGDSITLGVNVSGFRNEPPYLPPWPTLVADELTRRTGDQKIGLTNTALGGMTSKWADENARDAVASLNPDLVLIAFGMNDFWTIEPEEYRRNLESTMRTIRARRPKCEFVLLSPLRLWPTYTRDATYLRRLDGYREELRRLAAPGVALLDMTALSDALYQAKRFEDLGSDPMHPDDFFARCHAQALVALLSP